jgi:carbon-monoxide dehydrogenase large subunit
MVDPTSRRGIGASVLRREDPRFLTGAGRYTDDIAPAGVLHGAFVRSPHAHATVGTIDRDVVTSMPGVRVVLTGRDLEALGLSPIPSLTRTPPYRLLNLDGTEMPLASQFPLALDKARYVGEPVALVVAKTPTEARDAAEALPVEYDELPPAIDPNAAEVPGAARVWDDLDGNRSYE